MEDLNEPFISDCCTDNNLYISADDFFKILDEEAPDEESPQEFDLLGTLEGFDQGQLAPGQLECEDAFHPPSVTEDCWKTGTSQRDSSDYMDSSDYYSDGLLRLSTSKDNTLVDSVAGSPNSLVPGNFDCQEFDNNIQPYGVSNGSAEMAGFLYPTNSDLVNGLYLDSKQENDFVKMGGENSFQGGSEEPMADDMNISSLFLPQNGRIGESVLTADSSHDMLMQTSYCGGLMHFDMNTTTMPDSTALGGNVFSALSISSHLPPNVMLPDTIYTEMNSSETTDVTGNVSDTCPTFRLDSVSDVEIASTKVLHGQSFQSSLFREKGSMLHRSNQEVQQLHNSGMTSKVKLGTPEESLSTAALPMVSIIDLDEPSPSALCAGKNYWEDTRFNNESSTDSSPVPSSIYSTSDNVGIPVVNNAKRPMPSFKIALPNKKQKTWSKDKTEEWTHAARQKQHDIPTNNATFQRNYSKSSLSVDDDADICILDEISDPARPPAPLDHMKLHSRLQRSESTDPYYHGSGVPRVNTYDERPTIHLALQDLSEPKSESSPPDGVLAVSLLRHQRIALSWMVQRETINRHCTGGILADDQGLGKTISTLALILTERSPPSKNCLMTPKPEQLEALNVDDDDDGGGSDMKVIEQLRNSSTVMTSRPIKRENPVMVVKGRPAAGTLVVCPTSVLRQWADEIQNKVTSKANLSFLVYYGSNRTKDPNELAKYDVVITTYAIVSMEVPKQPLVDKDDEARVKVEASGAQSGLPISKKKKSSLNSKNQDSAMLESASRPLARVGWFRVILDEAQSIKNYRTQVARACWGLRAKRRWCLSGTPIQNAVDDLYSYFRFLRYAPFDVYKSFCSSIKMPISRNPTPGYRKLQILLQTIMLRRTKGTLLEGKPIINLPPKTVTLKKVDFSEEERTFYSTLEVESQEQYKEYAAAGTVKQNYVNILLLLLRLRQACDHPLLVKAYGSNSIGRASMDMVKKLSKDKQINLLSCLEACLAICTICKDPPEDAVVTICGHVFCNQCICEHLTGDDNICPSAQCKVRLTAASVFSRDTIKSCLSGQPELDCSSSSSVSHVENTHEKCEKGTLTSDSSKIKAALEILRALPLCSSSSNLKSSNDRSSSSIKNSVDPMSLSCSVGIDGKYLGSSKSSNDQAMEKAIVLSADRKYLGGSKSSNDKATEKAIVFSQWTRMLDLFEVPLKDSGIQYRRLDGTMSVVARDKAVKDFNTLPEVTVMIMSLKAASLGLNMIAACHVILLDLWWNPTTEDQAIDRAHRIGQTRPVTVSRLTVRDTVEDRILGLQEKKRKMVASAFGEDEAGSRQSRLSVDDLNFLFMGQGQ